MGTAKMGLFQVGGLLGKLRLIFEKFASGKLHELKAQNYGIIIVLIIMTNNELTVDLLAGRPFLQQTRIESQW